MPHTFYKIWLHVVFSTYNCEPIITSKLEFFLHKHLNHLLMESGCFPAAINGMPDHVHLLFQMNPNKPVAEIIRQIKNVSSHTINQSNVIENKFAWQSGYGAFSVSESQIEKVKEYIRSQKEHHKNISFSEEFEKFLQVHALESNGDSNFKMT